jgi:hypothetical protein
MGRGKIPPTTRLGRVGAVLEGLGDIHHERALERLLLELPERAPLHPGRWATGVAQHAFSGRCHPIGVIDQVIEPCGPCAWICLDPVGQLSLDSGDLFLMHGPYTSTSLVDCPVSHCHPSLHGFSPASSVLRWLRQRCPFWSTCSAAGPCGQGQPLPTFTIVPSPSGRRRRLGQFVTATRPRTSPPVPVLEGTEAIRLQACSR